MTAVGGSIAGVTIAGREFSVASDAEVQRKLGGFENEVMSNGNSTARIIKTRVPLSLQGIVINIDDSRSDQEFLQDRANDLDFSPIAITYASGITYQGSAIVSGELLGSSQSTTMPINLDGPGILTRQ